MRFSKALAGNIWALKQAKDITFASDRTIDMAIPFDSLDIAKGDTMEFVFVNARWGVKDFSVPDEMLLTIQRV